MERETDHHHWEKDPPTQEPPTPLLLQQLSSPESCKLKEMLPLWDRLSNKFRPLLSRLGQAKLRSRKPSLKLVKSLPQSLETNSLNQTNSSNILPHSTESRPSLLNHMNMETSSSTLYSEGVRTSLVMEVSDMKHLMEIMPEPVTQSMSTT